MKNIIAVGAVAAALTLGSAVGSSAAGLIQHSDLADGSVHNDTLNNGSVHRRDLSAGVNNTLQRNLHGAIYRVENYLNGGGGSATVACADDDETSQQYTAIAGGVQGSESGTTETQSGFLVSSSFPGRMNWDTGQPKPGRLDGWIVFGNSQHTSTLKVWALCVPNTNIPVQQVDLDN